MLKQECRVGMVVEMMPEGKKAIVVKINPKRAQVRTIEPFRERNTGRVWNCPYHLIQPVVGEHSMVVMKSFEQPENRGIKAYMDSYVADQELGELSKTDEYIVRAICEIYSRIDDTKGPERYELSSKINSLFTALGREVSQQVAENWQQKDSNG